MPRVYVVPTPGHRVTYFDAAGKRQILPEAGASVEDSTHWQRRRKDGEVVIGEPPHAAAHQPLEREE